MAPLQLIQDQINLMSMDYGIGMASCFRRQLAVYIFIVRSFMQIML